MTSTLLAAAQALTVTSKQLAGLAQARGFYHVDKGQGKKGKAKGKGRGKKGLSTKSKSQSKGFYKGKTGKGKGTGDSSAALRQSRLNGSTCLGCGSPDHWLKDCPSHTVQNAQITTAGLGDFSLDAEGMINSSWMVQSHALSMRMKRSASVSLCLRCVSSRRGTLRLTSPNSLQYSCSMPQETPQPSSLLIQVARDK